MADEPLLDDDLLEEDDEEEGSSKNRASNQITELYYFVLALALNQVTTSHDGLRANEQAAKMVELAIEWTDLIRSDFSTISRQYMGSRGVTEEQLKGQINKDNGKSMLKKAKAIVCVINNHLSSYWKEPEESASGKGREGIIALNAFSKMSSIPLSNQSVFNCVVDNLFACKKGAWAEKERIRIATNLKKWKGAAGEMPNGKPRVMDPKWHCPQFLTFQYLALPAGKNECRKIFRLTSGCGPVVKGAGKNSNQKGDLNVYFITFIFHVIHFHVLHFHFLHFHSKKAIYESQIVKHTASKENIADTILESAGRSARRVASSKPLDLTENDDDKEFNESKRQRIEMENFNGLQEWNTERDRLMGLVNLVQQMGGSPADVIERQQLLKAHLLKPFVRTVFCAPIVVGRTPSSAVAVKRSADQRKEPSISSPLPSPVSSLVSSPVSSPMASPVPSPIFGYIDDNDEAELDFDLD